MSNPIFPTIILPSLILAAAIVLFALVRLIYLAWRLEKDLSESLFLHNFARNLLANPEARNSLSKTAAWTIEALPQIRKALLEDVARKSHRTVDELEKALLANTGASSIEDALQAPMGDLSVEDTLLRILFTARDPFRLAARWWIQKSRRRGAVQSR